MLSAFQKAKIRREFTMFDVDGDGILSSKDFEEAAVNFADAQGWEEGGDLRQRLLNQWRFAWEELSIAADVDNNGTVEKDEYMAFYERLIIDVDSNPEDAPGWFKRVCVAHIRTLDMDEDGKISLDDYTNFLTAHNSANFDIPACFARLDLDGNGYIDPEECLILSLQFYLSNNPEDPGNWLWGPPSEDEDS